MSGRILGASYGRLASDKLQFKAYVFSFLRDLFGVGEKEAQVDHADRVRLTELI